MCSHILVIEVQLERVYQLYFPTGCAILLQLFQSILKLHTKPVAELAPRSRVQLKRINSLRVRGAGVHPKHRHKIDVEAREVSDVRAIVRARGAQYVLRPPDQRAHVVVECVPTEQILVAHLHSHVCQRYDTSVERHVVLEEREAVVFFIVRLEYNLSI